MNGTQDWQKQAYDKNAKEHRFKIGNTVMIHIPSLAAMEIGPTLSWVLTITPSNVET